MLLIELEDELDVENLVGRAIINRAGGTEEVHRVGRLASPGAGFLEIIAGFFSLEQDFHRRVLISWTVQTARKFAPPHPTDCGRDLVYHRE